VELPAEAGPDSLNLLPALLGGPRETGRDHLIEHAGGLALRKGTWKFIPHSPKPPATSDPGRGQLFNLAEDAGEKKNVAEQNPEKVKELSEALDRLRKSGRSRP
jgi:arylsulfatase A-like enzyme